MDRLTASGAVFLEIVELPNVYVVVHRRQDRPAFASSGVNSAAPSLELTTGS
jgi:hypothetical protein